MNQSIVRKLEEIHGRGEYHPTSKYVSKSGAKQFNLQEAHNNFTDEQNQEFSDLVFIAMATGKDSDKAKALDHFIKCSNEYWLWNYERNGKKQEETVEEALEDSFGR